MHFSALMFINPEAFGVWQRLAEAIITPFVIKELLLLFHQHCQGYNQYIIAVM